MGHGKDIAKEIVKPLATVLSPIFTGLPGLRRVKLLDLQVHLLVTVTDHLDRHGDKVEVIIPTGFPIMGYFPVEGFIFSVNSNGNV